MICVAASVEIEEGAATLPRKVWGCRAAFPCCFTGDVENGIWI
jgi:hypothetical protein